MTENVFIRTNNEDELIHVYIIVIINRPRMRARTHTIHMKIQIQQLIFINCIDSSIENAGLLSIKF